MEYGSSEQIKWKKLRKTHGSGAWPMGIGLKSVRYPLGIVRFISWCVSTWFIRILKKSAQILKRHTSMLHASWSDRTAPNKHRMDLSPMPIGRTPLPKHIFLHAIECRYQTNLNNGKGMLPGFLQFTELEVHKILASYMHHIARALSLYIFTQIKKTFLKNAVKNIDRRN